MSRNAYFEVPHDDFESEPVPGLPAPLPEGERMLWQGSPSWRSLAIRAFHVRKVAIYFAALMIWRFASSWAEGASPIDALAYAFGLAPLALAGLCILTLLAYGYARSTIYTITTRRVLIRSGVAMPVTANLPFKRIDSAGLKVHGDGTGDLPLQLAKEDRLAILAVWPNMRPWRWSRPEPMLRSVANPGAVADLLAAALSGARIPAITAEATGAHAPQARQPDLRPAT